MGSVIRFPRHHIHDRASVDSRAAKSVKTSAVTPAPRAVSLDRTADHHSAGMTSRCHHFDTAAAVAPVSEAMPSRLGHSSMIDRNEAGSMNGLIRQKVLKCKDNLSGDTEINSGQNVLMKQSESAKIFKDNFTARVAYARIKAGFSQGQIAEDLGLGNADDPSVQSKYQKYEKRSLMPHHLIPTFCMLCGITMAWLYTGPVVERITETRGRKPKQPIKLHQKRQKAA